MAKINLAFKFLSWTKLLKNYYNADKKDGDERESCWQACTKSSSLGPYVRKEPNYRTEILVKFAKKISVFKTSIENKNFEVSNGKPKLPCDKTGTFPSPCAKITRSGAWNAQTERIIRQLWSTWTKLSRFPNFYRKQNYQKDVGTLPKVMVQKTWAFLFRMCNIPTNRNPREETNYVEKEKKSRDEKMNLARFSKSFCRKTSKNHHTTTEISTAI